MTCWTGGRQKVRQIAYNDFMSGEAGAAVIERETQDPSLRSLKKDAHQPTFFKEKPFSLLVWNVHKGRRFFRWRDTAFTEIQQLRPDLTLLQEYVDDTPAVPSTFFNGHDASMVVGFYRHANRRHPAGVCTRSRVRNYSEKAFVSQNKEFSNTPKTALFTSYEIEGSADRLGVINIHGMNFVTSSIFKQFLDQIDEHARSHVGPLIFAGDFNTWSTSRVSLVKTVMQEHGLTEIFLPNATKSRGRIKPLFRRLGFGKKQDSAPVLDRIFTRGLRVENAHVLDSRASDHKPLSVRVSFI